MKKTIKVKVPWFDPFSRDAVGHLDRVLDAVFTQLRKK